MTPTLASHCKALQVAEFKFPDIRKIYRTHMPQFPHAQGCLSPQLGQAPLSGTLAEWPTLPPRHLSQLVITSIY